jgi:predicted esterase YcpF (UPF0227 family)
MTIKVEKASEVVTQKITDTMVTFKVNGKELRVYVYENWDDMQGTDYTIDPHDLAKLSVEEREAIEEESIWEMLELKGGEELIIQDSANEPPTQN